MKLIATPTSLARAYLTKNVLDKGRQGNGAWIAVGAVMLGLRLLSRVWGKEEVVWTATLAPGEKLLLEHLVEARSDA